jgi:predicted ArsR family transcriptional regulator
MARVDIVDDLVARLGHSAAVRRVLQDRADDLAAAVQRATPKRTGRTAETVRATAGVNADGEPVGRVYSTSRIWHLIEFGSKNNPAYAPMRTAAEQAGYKVKDRR